MTTFTLQDLTPAQQEAVKQHEAMHAAYQVLNTRSINDLPTTPEEDEAMKELFEKMGQDLTGKVPDLGVNAFETPVFSITPPHAPEPQPTLADIVNNICTQLQLLATLINQPQPQPQPEEGTNVPSLQETIELTLQQADWFKTMVHERAEELVDDKDFDYQIESAIETHFSNSFSLDDHVDISAEVESKVEDIAEDLLKDIVQEQLEEIVSNKLQNLRITFD
jgi:hypothetical protein